MAVHWGLDPDVVFLNHGSFGACPRVVLEKQRELRDLMEREPIRFFVETAEGLLDEARACVGKMMNADAEGIAFVPNATAGVNTVVRSLRFEPGDELLTNTHEYNACNNVLRWAAERWGAKVVMADVPFPVRSAREVADAVLGAVTSRTKLVMLSHITSPTGLVFPIGRIVEECSRCGIETLIDGAHGPGMVPIDLNALGATYYTGNFHKWLCAPKGAGFLWVSEARRGDIRPLIVSHGANSTRTDRARFRVEFDYCGTFEITPYLCVPAAMEFLSSLMPGGPIGSGGLMEHNRKQTLEARRILCEAMGTLGVMHNHPPTAIAPDSMIASLASVPIPDAPGGVIRPSPRGYHDALQDDLIARHGVQAPIVPWPMASNCAPGKHGGGRCVRVAMQAYNSVEQVRYLAECLVEELGGEKTGK
ncbi:MAG TPA: aminotransferase class V-fold PLP-dependent enzyme [Phycisphaerales bacterium]|nr:aminotransferase class V-fold PLP-dependent enzyme [Phycisphaerales bacterium]